MKKDVTITREEYLTLGPGLIRGVIKRKAGVTTDDFSVFEKVGRFDDDMHFTVVFHTPDARFRRFSRDKRRCR